MFYVKRTVISKLALLILFFLVENVFSAGLMTPNNANLPQLDIKNHNVNVVIEDGYAITQVEQVFQNTHNQDLEALYSFPVPEKAAVSEFVYWIDGKPVVAEVLPKKQAQQIYQEEKKAGRETAITEQDGFKTFDIKVYPVRANSEVKIRLGYIQPVHIDTAIGRYVYPLEDGGVDEQKMAFWTYNDKVKEQFSFKLRFRSSYPIDQLRLPHHPQAVVNKSSKQEAEVTLGSRSANVIQEGKTSVAPASHAYDLNKDIVVYWRHKEDLPGAVDLLTHKPDQHGTGTFMLTFTPGDDLPEIQKGRDWIFVLDYSGSMQGKYQSLLRGVKQGLKKLGRDDRFRIILFNNHAQEITSGHLSVNPNNINHVITQMETNQPHNGTNLYAGLEKGLDALDADRSSAIILVTDGVANIGQTEKKDFLKLLKKADVRLFTFVMGNSANRPLLEGMAKVSNGFSISVSNSDDIVGKLMEATSKMTHYAYRDISLDISGIKVRNLTPDDIRSLYRGEQLIVFGHYWGDGEAKVSLNAKISGQKKSYSTTFKFPKHSVNNPEIERLWAFAKIEDLQQQMDYMGQNADTEQAITDLAVQYGLVTDYTSVLVVREEQFKKYAIKRNNAKRLAIETQAQQQRAQAPLQNTRVDTQNPMFNRPAASHRGGGNMDMLMLCLLLPLLFYSFKREK